MSTLFAEDNMPRIAQVTEKPWPDVVDVIACTMVIGVNTRMNVSRMTTVVVEVGV
jgi:hypothetical protein